MSHFDIWKNPGPPGKRDRVTKTKSVHTKIPKFLFPPLSKKYSTMIPLLNLHLPQFTTNSAPQRNLTNLDWSFPWRKSKCFDQKKAHSPKFGVCKGWIATKVHKAPKFGWWGVKNEISKAGESWGYLGSSELPLRGEATLLLYKTMKIKIEKKLKFLFADLSKTNVGFGLPVQLQEHPKGAEITITPISREKINWVLSCRIKWSKAEPELPDLAFLGSWTCPSCFFPSKGEEAAPAAASRIWFGLVWAQ